MKISWIVFLSSISNVLSFTGIKQTMEADEKIDLLTGTMNNEDTKDGLYWCHC